MSTPQQRLQCVQSTPESPFRTGVCYEAFIGENSICVIDEQQNQCPMPRDTMQTHGATFALVEEPQ